MDIEENSEVTALRSVFAHNHAARFGGVFFMRSEATLNLDNCTINDNACDYRGGVVYAESNSALAALETVFTNNSACHGGTVFIDHAYLTLDHCIFTDNNCEPCEESKGIGGALFSYISTIVAFGTAFSRNYAAYFGGAAYIEFQSDLTLENCTFSENSCGFMAGVMHVSRDSSIKAMLTRFEYYSILERLGLCGSLNHQQLLRTASLLAIELIIVPHYL